MENGGKFLLYSAEIFFFSTNSKNIKENEN